MNDIVRLDKVIDEINKAFDRFMADARTYTDVYRLRKQKEELVDQIHQLVDKIQQEVSKDA